MKKKKEYFNRKKTQTKRMEATKVELLASLVKKRPNKKKKRRRSFSKPSQQSILDGCQKSEVRGCALMFYIWLSFSFFFLKGWNQEPLDLALSKKKGGGGGERGRGRRGVEKQGTRSICGVSSRQTGSFVPSNVWLSDQHRTTSPLCTLVVWPAKKHTTVREASLGNEKKEKRRLAI